MPFKFPTTASPPYEDQAPVAEIIIAVRGNCGIIHNSLAEWQKCAWCACGPQPLRYERFDR